MIHQNLSAILVQKSVWVCVFYMGNGVDTLCSHNAHSLDYCFPPNMQVGGSGGMTQDISTDNISPAGQASDCSEFGCCSWCSVSALGRWSLI